MKGVCVSWGGGVLRENGHLALHIGECDGCACGQGCCLGLAVSVHGDVCMCVHVTGCVCACVHQ